MTTHKRSHHVCSVGSHPLDAQSIILPRVGMLGGCIESNDKDMDNHDYNDHEEVANSMRQLSWVVSLVSQWRLPWCFEGSDGKLMSHENGNQLWDNGDNAVTCFEIKAAAMALRGRTGHVLRGRRARRMEMPCIFLLHGDWKHHVMNLELTLQQVLWLAN